MTRPAVSAPRPAQLLGLLGFAALGVITLSDPGATRMYAWPWTIAYAATLAVPAALLALRLYGGGRPLAVPAPLWWWSALAGLAVPVFSAMFSRYRGPSLLHGAPLLAAVALFLVVFDWLHAEPGAVAARRDALWRILGGLLALVVVASLASWALDLPHRSLREIADARNPHPLGHTNYTAGLALLMLPVFARLAHRAVGAPRAGWIGALVLALTMLVTSGSRGGLVGLAALFGAALLVARLGWKRTTLIALAAVVVTAAVAFIHPRTRAMFQRATASELKVSDVQRTAMLEAGLAMGAQRPVLGWGAGSVPLAYPLFRRFLDGGTENVLQLHSLPVQLWAELGGAGLAGFLLLLILVARHGGRDPAAAVALAGYLAFALTDYQLDVPVFGGVVAALAACLAPPADPPVLVPPRALDWVFRLALLMLACFGRPDPTPAMNTRALRLARDPAKAAEAVQQFETSLQLNPDQEIAHFNLGWLQVVSQPDAAARHFRAAARLVPDKGGVYFGLALAQLNQGRRDEAVQALAAECLNDPIFVVSPWWRTPALGPLRPATLGRVREFLDDALTRRRLASRPDAREAQYLLALLRWLDDQAAPGEILAAANTPERAGYFARRPARPDFAAAPVLWSRRERPGYPVLMRNLDLPVPVDLFEVQENALAAGELHFLFPHKGWLPTSLLNLLAGGGRATD
ncbi:MAG: O-antigen ligase family protein [Verrucomicrobia bacterium]|nr:O-antigen ligase family protein [Verrucomicrobiota bacterium]